MRRSLFYGLTAGLLGLALYSQQPKPQTVGPLGGGGFLLNTGWRIRPAGTEIPLSTLPMSAALSPDGRMLAALNGGYLPSSVDLLDMETMRKVSGISITDGWRGLAFSPNGEKLYAGGGALGAVVELKVESGRLTAARRFDLYPGEKPGMAHLIGDIIYQDDRLLVADTAQDKVIVVNAASGAVLRAINTVRNPYSMLLAPDGKSLFVSSWSTGQLVRYSIADGSQMTRIDVGPHPTEMILLPPAAGKSAPRLAVACANTNYVYVLEQNGGSWRFS